jgi:uncharacterized protein (TIGR03435 family)
MVGLLAIAVVSAAGFFGQGQAPHPRFDRFDVATIKLAPSDVKRGRYITMQGTHRFIENDYTLKLLIAAAYDLNPQAISGGPAWLSSDHYDILAVTPGEARPTRDEQMAMLRTLLADRFKLSFHREQKEFSVYALEVAKSGAKLKQTVARPEDPVVMGPGQVFPQRILLPARNATIGDFTSLLQRAILDRPVVDRTGLPGRFDFDLEWAPDESQFGGDIPAASAAAPSLPIFSAIRQELGLKLEPTKAPIDAIVVDGVERPSEN